MFLLNTFLPCLIPILVGCCALLSGCDTNKHAAPPEKVTIAIYPSYHTTLVQVAQIKGYFQKEGLDVALQLHPSGKAAIQSLMKKQADVASAADTPVMFAIMKGAKVSVFATIRTSSKSEAIVARRDMGIRTESDLKGKKIGVPRGTAADFFLNSYLLVHGIKSSDVEVIDLEPNAVHDALVRGAVSAVAAWVPITTGLQGDLGDNGITFHDENIYTETFDLIESRELMQQRPQLTNRLLRALVKAEGFVSLHPKESQQIVADFCHLDPASVAEVWDFFRFEVSLKQSLLVSLEDQAHWAIKNGLTDGHEFPSLYESIKIEGLKSVKPDAVRMIR